MTFRGTAPESFPRTQWHFIGATELEIVQPYDESCLIIRAGRHGNVLKVRAASHDRFCFSNSNSYTWLASISPGKTVCWARELDKTAQRCDIP